MNLFLLLSFFMLIFINICESANVLCVFPFPVKSHYNSLRPIGLELAKRGHNVTVITSQKETVYPPEYHQVLVEGVGKTAFDRQDGSRTNVFNIVDMYTAELIYKLIWLLGISYTEKYLTSKEVQDMLHKDTHFDMIISEQMAQEAFSALAYKYRAPLVLVSTFGNAMKHNIVTKNPLQLEKKKFELADIEDPISFIGRLKNLYISLFEYVGWKYWYLGLQEELMRRYIPNLPEDMPSLFELQQNASLLLLNSHFSFDPPTAYLPNIVEIGGIHLTQSDLKLPDDLQTVFDEAKHGVVYVCLGSNIKSSELPEEKKRAFINVFGRLKETVLWKWEDENLGDAPKNVITRKWMPQNEILAHPKVKLFISHGGLIGTQEAIFHGVPIIGIPIFADQYNNLRQVETHSFGKILNYHDINEQTMATRINEILNNNTYKDNAVEVSRRFRDRPMSPLDTAVFWIEYVIRNKGASFMKNPSIGLSWFTLSMIDVYLFLSAVVVALIYILFKITSALIKCVIKKFRQKQKML